MKMLSNRTGGFLPALLLAMTIAFGLPAQKVQAQDYYNNGYYNDDNYYDNGNYQEFYDDLAPYGQWLNDPQYGYVWAPSVGPDFRPYYTNGYWAMTEYGNMWISNYAWGWAPFHYGRWAQSAIYGWIWIPGSVWGPAWVTWRQGGGYYGWAPMGPGVSINISFGSGFNVPNPWWTFIPCGHIYSRNWHTYYSPRRTVNIINNTTIINNTYVDNRTRNTYVTGPRRSEVEAVTRKRVTVYNVSDRSRAGAASLNGRSVNVYRPRIGTVSGRTQERPAPRQVKSLERTAVTNTGGGRAPRQNVVNRNNITTPDPQSRQQNVIRDRQAIQQDRQVQQRIPADRQRIQEQRMQQTVQRRQAEQQVQQQRIQQQREQQIQRQQVEQRVQQQRMQQQREQQIQRQQVEQRAQQQRMQQQREQQVQRQQVQRQQVEQQRMQQRSVERQQMPQRNVERSQPQQRSVERAPRGR